MRIIKAVTVGVLGMLALTVPIAGFAELVVGDFEQVSERRVSRTDFEYQLRVNVTNSGPSAVNVSAAVSGGGTGTTILDGELSFPDVAAGASANSSDTITIRHNRRYPLDTGALEFSFDFDEVASTPLSVNIETPESLITVGASPIQVSGSVSPEGAALTVNGAEVLHTGGSFVASVALQEGHNTIVARAVNSGDQSTDSISVSLDLTPPYLTIDSHQDGQTVYEDRVTVTGLINDIVRGTIETAQANVTVNGLPAAIANRSYAATDVPLVEGANLINVQGSDQVGNTSQTSITLNYEVPDGRRIEIAGGQAQTALINTLLAQPLVVRVLDDASRPVVGETVVFRVVQGSGVVGVGTSFEGRAYSAPTDSNGMANTAMQVGARAGTANHKVRAAAVGYDTEVVFNASATGSVGNKISINSGNNQRGIVGEALAEPFVTVVTDAGANVVQGARVRYEATVGGGSFAESASIEVITDSDGRATAQYVLGELEGLDAQRVTATLLDTDGTDPVSGGFSATGFVAGDPADTTISGVVLDNQDAPIPGVTIRIEGTTREAVADEQGQFVLMEVPVGPVHLLADGSTATVDGEWPTLSYNLVALSGVDNPLPAPIYMVKLDTDNAVLVGTQDAVITVPEVPGFELFVKANSVTFPDGSREGLMSVTAVNASKVPMAPPNGMQPQLIVTIQPTGARFDPPAPLTLPNVDGHAPGAQVEMYSYDHDLEEFVSIGLGTVSEDGSLVKTNAGVGVVKAGWHCGSQPGGQGCANGCGECEDCDSNCNCIPNDSKDIGECKECSNGSAVNKPDSSPIAGAPCEECRGGIEANKNNGATSANASMCCFAGQEVPKTPIADISRCPQRVDNPSRGKEDDGCSVPDNIPIGDPNNPMQDANTSFAAACSGHDRCYGTCSRDAAHKNTACDENFENQMAAVCDAAYSPLFDPIDYTQCQTFANAYWAAVRFGGQDAYNARQLRGCDCC